MMAVVSIARRELASMFRVPVGWAVIALHLLVAGVFFRVFALVPGEVASMRAYFELGAVLLLVVCPAVSMRLFSEELRSGTIESLMTAPVGDLASVAGKYAAAVLFLVVMLGSSWVYVGVLVLVAGGPVDLGPVWAGYLSLVLTGCLYLSIGTLISTLTSSQTLAFLGSFLAMLGVLMGPGLAGPRLPDPMGSWVLELAIGPRVRDLAKGVIDPRHAVYFLSVSAWFVLGAYVSLNSRRWR